MEGERKTIEIAKIAATLASAPGVFRAENGRIDDNALRGCMRDAVTLYLLAEEKECGCGELLDDLNECTGKFGCSGES